MGGWVRKTYHPHETADTLEMSQAGSQARTRINSSSGSLASDTVIML